MSGRVLDVVQIHQDRQEFQEFLTKRHISTSEVDQAIELIAQFDKYLAKPANQVTINEIRTFIQHNSGVKKDPERNLTYLYYYGKYVKSNPITLASLELLDGGEVMDNFYKKLGEYIGNELRDKIFHDIECPSYGTAPLKKARTMQVVMDRVEQLADPNTIVGLLDDCLRDLGEGTNAEERKRYEDIGDFDVFLEMKRQEYVQYLQGFADRGELYYTQEITNEVVAFVRDNPEVAQGVCEDNILYITKIPYMTKEYLAEDDEVKKRYYYCHCPWARESLKNGEKTVSATFCHCSAGFIKKPWEAIFGQKLEVDILESILQGDLRCRFAIHLPEGTIKPE